MTEFAKQPKLHLNDEASLRNALTNPEWANQKRVPEITGIVDIDTNERVSILEVRSAFIVDLITRMIAESRAKGIRNFAYNVDVQREVERLLGLPAGPENGTTLSWLVYAAQGFQRSEALVAEGYVPLTPELVLEAKAAKCKVMTPSGQIAAPREKDGHVYLFLAKSRTQALSVNGQAVRLIDPKKSKALSAEAAERSSLIKIVVSASPAAA